jgi:hypothetical protein
MRDTQAALRRFIDQSGIDFARFGGVNWDHRISVAASNQTVWAFGSFAGPVGLIYLMQDLRVAGGTVADAVMTVRGLEPHEGLELPVVFWDPADASQPPASGSVIVSGGIVDIMVPGFQRGMVVSVPEPASTAGGLAAIGALLMLCSMCRSRQGAGRAGARPSDHAA